MDAILSCGGYRQRSPSRERSTTNERILFKGWLIKSPPVLSENSIFSRSAMRQFQPKWHRRYFVLYVTRINQEDVYLFHYYKEEQQLKRMGSIDLTQTENIVTMVVPPKILMQTLPTKYTENRTNPLPFFGLETFHNNSLRMYYLLADNLENMERWVDNLTTACGLKEEGADEEDYYPDQAAMPFPTNTMMSTNTMGYPRSNSQQITTSIMSYNQQYPMSQSSMMMRGSNMPMSPVNPQTPSMMMYPQTPPQMPSRQASTTPYYNQQQGDTYYNILPSSPTGRDRLPAPPLPNLDSVYGVPVSDGHEFGDGIYRINSPTEKKPTYSFDQTDDDDYKIPTAEEMARIHAERDSLYRVPTDVEYTNLNSTNTTPNRQPSLKPRKFSLKYKNRPVTVQKTNPTVDRQSTNDEDEMVKTQDYVNVSNVVAKLRAGENNNEPLDLSTHQDTTIQLPKRLTAKGTSESEGEDDKHAAKIPTKWKGNYIKIQHVNNNSDSVRLVSTQYTEVDDIRTKALAEMSQLQRRNCKQ